MPRTKPKLATANPRSGASFRKRYDDLERQRATLLARLEALGERGRQNPLYKNAQKLLSTTFRKSSLVQRLGVLQAATWVIETLERVIWFA